MTSLYWPEFCRVGFECSTRVPPRGKELQTAEKGVRPGVKTGFDDGVERCLLMMMMVTPSLAMRKRML